MLFTLSVIKIIKRKVWPKLTVGGCGKYTNGRKLSKIDISQLVAHTTTMLEFHENINKFVVRIYHKHCPQAHVIFFSLMMF